MTRRYRVCLGAVTAPGSVTPRKDNDDMLAPANPTWYHKPMASQTTTHGTVPAWAGRRRQRALHRIKQLGRRANTPCVICHQPIDYTLNHPHPMACTVQHLIPRNIRPDLTWDPANHAPAHSTCNSSDGDGTTGHYDLGQTSKLEYTHPETQTWGRGSDRPTGSVLSPSGMVEPSTRVVDGSITGGV